jgi:hypothetical protein
VFLPDVLESGDPFASESGKNQPAKNQPAKERKPRVSRLGAGRLGAGIEAQRPPFCRPGKILKSRWIGLAEFATLAFGWFDDCWKVIGSAMVLTLPSFGHLA